MKLKQYLIRLNDAEDSQFKNMNKGVYKGKRFWSGVYDILSGNIISTSTYETAEDNDFHHTFYIPRPIVKKIANGEAIFFWVDFNGKLNADWHINLGNTKSLQSTLNKIKKKINVVK